MGIAIIVGAAIALVAGVASNGGDKKEHSKYVYKKK